MKKKEQLYEGKAKIIYATDDSDLIIQYFKDDATAFNGQKKGIIQSKGTLNNSISSYVFRKLGTLPYPYDIPTHFVSKLSDREMLCKRVKIIPIEMVVRNVIAGSLSERMGKPEGEALTTPILEFYYKRDDLNDPMINEGHVIALNLVRTFNDLNIIKEMVKIINGVLLTWFRSMNICLVDFKAEFGYNYSDGKILLADEISPDSCRLWDANSGDKMDKDRFRRNLGSIEDAYQEVFNRIKNKEGELS